VAAAWSGLPYDSISMDRSECFGSCPSYLVEFVRGAGEESLSPATYEGRSYVELEGRHLGEIDLWSYARLCQLLDHLNFRSLSQRYAANWTDDFTVVIRAEHRDGAHQVSDYGQQAPPDFMALRFAIDATLAEVEWRPE
jgi:hypothetical protein